jgi:hypothetical protein
MQNGGRLTKAIFFKPEISGALKLFSVFYYSILFLAAIPLLEKLHYLFVALP